MAPSVSVLTHSKSALLSTSLSDAQWTEHLPSVCEIITEL